MEINVKFTAIEWWKLKLQEAKDEKLEYKIKHAEKQLGLAKFLNKHGVNREIEEKPTFIYGFKINNCVKY
tara:strand:+ start:211 stop:420 length:210 start_codon:yes stop_codon:yes gene_type:complete